MASSAFFILDKQGSGGGQDEISPNDDDRQSPFDYHVSIDSLNC